MIDLFLLTRDGASTGCYTLLQRKSQLVVAEVAEHLAAGFRNRDYYWHYFHHKTLLRLFFSIVDYLVIQPFIITRVIEFVIMLESSLYYTLVTATFDFVQVLIRQYYSLQSP